MYLKGKRLVRILNTAVACLMVLMGGAGSVTVVYGANLNATLDSVYPFYVSHPHVLYFPHVATIYGWETEICVINTTDKDIGGIFYAYNDKGFLVYEKIGVILPPHGRKQLNVGTDFVDPIVLPEGGGSNSITNITFMSDASGIIGYTKFYIEGRFRVAIPAVTEKNDGDIYISHIASNDQWWTGVALLNTTPWQKTVTIFFDNGETKTKDIEGYNHLDFTIRNLFEDQPQPDTKSAKIKNATGIIGLMLFGTQEGSGQNYLSGVLLNNQTTERLYYPHVAEDADWWTGIVAYNPFASNCNITITPYQADGTALQQTDEDIESLGKYVGTITDLNLPNGTEWFEITASNPITGFELFGTRDNNRLAGYTSVGIKGKEGVFPKIEKDGWTGVAFVNTEDKSGQIRLSAFEKDGAIIADRTINLGAKQKQVDIAEEFFLTDISTATHIGYTSETEVVGFQLNGSTDDMMLDALPGIKSERLDIVTIAAGTNRSLAIKADGSLHEWGKSYNISINDGVVLYREKYEPTPVCSNIDRLESPPLATPTSDWLDMATGGEATEFHSLAIKSDGSLWAWGDNSYGQLGIENLSKTHIPLQVGEDMDWRSISAGGRSSLGIKTNGTLWKWGYVTLGDALPVQVGNDREWDTVAAGSIEFYAIKTDGSLWRGEYFPEDPENQVVKVGEDKDWVKVTTSSNGAHVLALKSDGTLWAWGDNRFGQLGDGTLISKEEPVRVGITSDWVDIAAGTLHSLALKSDRSLWAWGYNSLGQLGDGTLVSKLEPIQVGTATDWVDIAAGSYHSIGLKSDGTLWAWGDNGYGQLGVIMTNLDTLEREDIPGSAIPVEIR